MRLVYQKNILIRELETLRDLTFLHFPEHFLFVFFKLSNVKTVSRINAAFSYQEANHLVSGHLPGELSACFINILSGLIWSSKFWLLINVCGWAESSAEVKDNKLVNPSEMGHRVSAERM